MTRAIFLSDTHLVSGGTNTDALAALLEDLQADPPDELILGGDIFELWRGDLAGVMWLASDMAAEFARLRDDQGVTVTLLKGNHDDYLSRNLEWDRGYDFEQVMDYETTLDGVDYLFTHGHKYEPTYIPPVNEVLSWTNDRQGSLSDWLWANRPVPDNPVERAALTLAGPAASFLDPEVTTQHGVRLSAIERGIRLDADDDQWGVFGHTHRPYLDEDERIANAGSMTGEQSTYVEIIDGVPHLRGNRVHEPDR